MFPNMGLPQVGAQILQNSLRNGPPGMPTGGGMPPGMPSPGGMNPQALIPKIMAAMQGNPASGGLLQAIMGMRRPFQGGPGGPGGAGPFAAGGPGMPGAGGLLSKMFGGGLQGNAPLSLAPPSPVMPPAMAGMPKPPGLPPVY